jgi:hypothetical protein
LISGTITSTWAVGRRQHLGGGEHTSFCRWERWALVGNKGKRLGYCGTQDREVGVLWIQL